MRILIISHVFAPYNHIGSVRVSKTAKYLQQANHELRILTMSNCGYPATLPLEIPPEWVIATPWLKLPLTFIKYPTHPLASITQQLIRSKQRMMLILAKKLIFAYRTIFFFPDIAIGWFPFAMTHAHTLLKYWKPDIILASGPSFVSLLIANTLHSHYQIPWVGELRDLWADNHQYPYADWRRPLEAWFERHTLATSAGLITVSEPLAQTLRWRYNKPTEVILHGFDLGDYPQERKQIHNAKLKIIYTGIIHAEKQQASPLFAALQQLGPRAAQIQIIFYSALNAGTASMLEQARTYGVEHLVQFHDLIPYSASLAQQTAADILLLLTWIDRRERGVYTGKLFEYLGARRPILGIGPDDNVAADLIHERQAGIVLQDKDAIAQQLLIWLDAKQRNGHIPDLPISVTSGLSRQAQTLNMAAFLERVREVSRG
ncbi:glycosyltransferase [Candidatus Viridilinea mediisalina]|uniref:Glycosyltransferase subfamily 4-like N-terminal domain-containing protein n=1 Tax=Candidatus Viridilinea mediisalina TaxID=2024553 RepID=A0A2A6RMA5_9CHLR|nr:glycosyltransferase [Candidatus Viridilinea mediisalina]PDW04031.1 hypothetical protein CJ255_05515 [Candidatus Viridilinea mediisalina]